MKFLSEEEELALEKNLVWIFADRRSGTTWLAKELLSFQTKTMDEPLIGLHLGGRVFLRPHLWSLEATDGFARTIDLEKQRDDYFFSEKYRDGWKIFLKKLILNRIYDQFNNISSKIIIKEPSGSMASDIIANCLPNSKIIILLRDGRDVVDSKIDESRPDGWEIKLKKGNREPITEEDKLHWIDTYARMWVSQMKVLTNTFENHHKNLRYLLRYEDLIKNTLSELQKIYNFIGIKIDQSTLEEIIKKFSFENISEKEKGKGKFRRFATPGKWKDSFNEEEKLLLEKIMKPMLQKLNFE